MLDREIRRHFREIARRRGHNVHDDPDAHAGWARCRSLGLDYLEVVIAAHAAGGAGAVAGFGADAHLSPDEQAVARDADPKGWARRMEDTPWFPGRTLGDPALERLEAAIFEAWEEYLAAARSAGEAVSCAGFDVERARLFRAGATAIGFPPGLDEIARLTAPGMDASGERVAVELPYGALEVLGPDWPLTHPLPRIELKSRLVPDWEFPGYWLLVDNREVSLFELANLLEGQGPFPALELAALRGEISLAEFRARKERDAS
jgi:hypothetical protein